MSTIDSNDKSYPVDEFGRPAGRNYNYRIPVENDRALRKLRIAEKILDRWFSEEWKVLDGYVEVQTRDKKGHLPGLAEYNYARGWEKFPARGRLGRLEMKNAPRGGTRLKGSVFAGFTCYGVDVDYVGVDFTVGATPSEIRAAYETGKNEDEVVGEIEEALHWVLEDRYEEVLAAVGDDLEADGVDLETFTY